MDTPAGRTGSLMRTGRAASRTSGARVRLVVEGRDFAVAGGAIELNRLGEGAVRLQADRARTPEPDARRSSSTSTRRPTPRPRASGETHMRFSSAGPSA